VDISHPECQQLFRFSLFPSTVRLCSRELIGRIGLPPTHVYISVNRICRNNSEDAGLAKVTLPDRSVSTTFVNVQVYQNIPAFDLKEAQFDEALAHLHSDRQLVLVIDIRIET